MPARKLPKPKKKRRTRGEGSIGPDKRRGGWMAKVPIGRYPNGRTKHREVRGATQAEVVAKRKLVVRPGPDVTVGEWCDRWLAALKVRAGSRKVYAARVKERIRPTLGDIQLAALSAWDVEVAAGKWTGKANTVRDTISTLGTILQAARRAKLVTENVVELVRKPAASETAFDLFTRAELKSILDAARARPTWHTFVILVLTGARIGEAIALRPADYDAAKGRLAIKRTWTAEGEGPPKSKHSLRTIEVPAELREILAAGPPRCHYQTAASRWEKLLESLGLRYRGAHQIRHSVASYALADGVPIPDLAAHLGHTPEELLRTYGHRTGADVCGAIGRIVGL